MWTGTTKDRVNTRRCVCIARTLSVLTVLIASSAHAQWELEKIWDRSQGVPGAPGINVVLDEPAYDGVNFVFRTRKTGEYDGIHMIDGDGEIHLVADINTVDPMYGLLLKDFLTPTLSSGHVAVIAHTDLNPSSVFLWADGELTAPVSFGTVAPGGTSSFVNFFLTRLSENQILYTGRSLEVGSSPVRGIYLHSLLNGTDDLIINSIQPVPGLPGEEFFTFDSIDLEGNAVVFTARHAIGTASAVYMSVDGEVSLLFDESHQVPGTEMLFSGFARARIDHGQVSFLGYGDDLYDGIFAWSDGDLSTVVDSETPIPGDGTTLEQIRRDFSTHNHNFVFLSNTDLDPVLDPDPTGLFGVFNGKLSTILRVGDELDGKTVERILLHQEGLHESTVAFLVSFGPSSAIYTATLSTPGDANGDHAVNMVDLNIVLGNFLRSGEPGLPGDVNDDGAVDLADLNMVLAHFGVDCT